MGDSDTNSPTDCIPRLRNEFPRTLVATTIAVKMRVLEPGDAVGIREEEDS